MRATPQEKAHAWARYRRLMLWMALAAAVSVVVALTWLWQTTGPLPIPMIIATVAGVFFSVMLGTALMGLVFLSAGAGHDDEAGATPGDKEP